MRSYHLDDIDDDLEDDDAFYDEDSDPDEDDDEEADDDDDDEDDIEPWQVSEADTRAANFRHTLDFWHRWA